jgi:hypothetical protein
MKTLKTIFVILIFTMNISCSVPYWIEYSYSQMNTIEIDCIKDIANVKYRNIYKNRFNELYVESNVEVKEKSTTINIESKLEINKSNIIYKLHWTSANKKATHYMLKKENITNFEKAQRHYFDSILKECIRDFKIICKSRVAVSDALQDCIDD